MLYLESIQYAIEKLITEKDLILLGEDIAEPYGGAFKVTKGLSDKYPNNVIQTPMSEQGFTGMAVGIALEGRYSMSEIMFGDFITLAADQIINHAAKLAQLYKCELHYVLRAPMGGYRGYGATHSQSIERLFFGIPGIGMVAPSVYHDPGAMLVDAAESGKPTIFVEYKMDYSKKIHEKGLVEDLFNMQRSKKNDGVTRLSIPGEKPALTVITYGETASMVVRAAKSIFIADETVCEIFVVGNLLEGIAEVEPILKTTNVLIVEEGCREFGYAAEIGFKLMQKNFKVTRIGAKMSFVPCGKAMEESMLPSLAGIKSAIACTASGGVYD